MNDKLNFLVLSLLLFPALLVLFLAFCLFEMLSQFPVDLSKNLNRNSSFLQSCTF